ncbi:MAG: pyridoxal phosphate-dependent aminotransferase, partial [Fibrobacteria bacterium]|nr:pyridoxal phosphate-dependent aminotransferase [Fibrobacteria bacterium]
MAIAKKIETFITRSSWIRKMFEEGAKLKAEHGATNVFDFSLGNPNLEPP